jgi:glyoxylase-like metal-dependent hydrolase (beta-lactamase superfamily II)
MIIERTEHPSWLSNAYLVADAPGGHGVLIDGNGVAEPLLGTVDRDGITVTHVLLTHEDHDHVVDAEAFRERFGAPILASAASAQALGGIVDETLADGDTVRSGSLEIQALATPGHCLGHLAFLVGGTDCFTADCLFRGTIGGTRGRGEIFSLHRASIMERLLGLPAETRIHPGHAAPSTVGVEWESNPFVRAWRGLDPVGAEPCRVSGEEATLLLWGPDYDGTHKAWVRFPDGQEAIVGGSRVERL